ncbi:MAG TPA: hypothetical protein VFE90_21940 [Myxococcales bacterium]|nr:hypothetical protein [Myxococcales bacterium]
MSLAELLASARAAFKAGEARKAADLFARAQALAPRDPEIPHERGLALLEAGEVGLAARAQGEALGDDRGAADELRRLLEQLGPQPALSARLLGLEASAQRAAARRLLGAPPARLGHSPLVGTAFVRSDPLRFHAPFAELSAAVQGGAIARLDLVFASMDASMARSDLSYGGTTEDEHGRRVPLDEFSAAAIVFLSESLGVEPIRARRLLSFLLTEECGTGPHRLAGAQLGWTIAGGNGTRQYGLYTAA